MDINVLDDLTDAQLHQIMDHHKIEIGGSRNDVLHGLKERLTIGGDGTIYYGVNELKKGQKRPTLKQATEKKQLRYYGVKKVTKEQIEKAKMPSESAKLKKELDKLDRDLIMARGELNKLKREEFRDTFGDQKKSVSKEEEALQKKIKGIIDKRKEIKEELSKAK